MKIPKQKSINQLVADLDKVFSIFIRTRDINEEGYSFCVTCGKPMTLKTSQCGHFRSRTKYATRWEEKNCAAQCVGCNIFKEGMHYEVGCAIDKKYGAGTAEMLRIKSQNTFDKNRTVLNLLINHYKNKI